MKESVPGEEGDVGRLFGRSHMCMWLNEDMREGGMRVQMPVWSRKCLEEGVIVDVRSDVCWK